MNKGLLGVPFYVLLQMNLKLEPAHKMLPVRN